MHMCSSKCVCVLAVEVPFVCAVLQLVGVWVDGTEEPVCVCVCVWVLQCHKDTPC